MIEKLIEDFQKAFDNHPLHHQVGTPAYLKSKKEYFRCRDALIRAGIDPREVSSTNEGRTSGKSGTAS